MIQGLTEMLVLSREEVRRLRDTLQRIADIASDPAFQSDAMGWIQQECRRAGIVIQSRPIIVYLCGSGRFREAYEQAEACETLAGKIVLTIGVNTKDVAREPGLKGLKPFLDELHLRKIDLADEVLVLNVGGYIGESTANEIAYARERGKLVRYLDWSSRAPKRVSM